MLAILCSLSINLTFAQDADSEEPAAGSSITPDSALYSAFVVSASKPQIKSSSVIAYSDGLSIAIEFDMGALVPQNIVFADKVNANNSRTLNLSGGKVEFFGVYSGKEYEIKALGDNGLQYVIGTLNTSPYKAGDPVVVSENLYRSLSQYVSIENQQVTLSNYLKQIPNVSQHEKTSFLQRFVMNGAVLPSSIKGQYPDAYVKEALTDRRTEGECMCNFIMNQVTVIVPDESGISDFSIGPKTTAKGPNFYNNSSFWFRGITAQGPAKKQLLENMGKNAGSKRRTESWISGGDNVSDNFVRIGYHLMCIGESELPRECDCEKLIKYDFGYSTKIEARTNTGGFGCIFNQDAEARAQDWAVAVVTREKINSVNDVQILQSGLGIATSTCKGGVPASVIIDAAKIGVSVFQLVKSVKTAQLNDIVNQTNQIIDKIGAVLTVATEAKDCISAIIEKPLLQGVSTFNFKPNDPISFMVVSGSSMEVRGLRCWESSAAINSSFHLAGIVQGGAPTPSTAHCCTNYFANWAYASQNGDDSNRRNFINGHLALNSPGGWQTINGLPNNGAGINIPTSVGYAIGLNLPDNQRCPKEIPIFNNPR